MNQFPGTIMKYRFFYPYILIFLCVSVGSLLVAGCTIAPKAPPITPKTALRKVSFFRIPAFMDDMAYDGLEHCISKSISYLMRVPSDRMFQFGEDRFSADHMIKSLEHFLNFIQTNPSQRKFKKFIKSNYQIYESVGLNKTGKVLFTGYYEPILHGRLNRSDEYRFPVYGRPNDLLTIDLSLFSSRWQGEKIIARYSDQTVTPYHDRREIDNENVLAGKARTIAWVKDPIDLFFLQIQGSGKIYLDNGHTIHIHYHTSNGRAYRSIGKLLIDEGKIPRSEMSMQAIRMYLHTHPEEVQTILNYNPSYIFFKIEDDGPIGYIGEKLTPGRSIAVDWRIFPLAALAFIETKKPLITGDGRIHQWNDFSRFVVSQDTGGAIRGSGRADLFWGNGTYAEIAAGHLQHHGNLYFLVLKKEIK